jgi:hypothetical protein
MLSAATAAATRELELVVVAAAVVVELKGWKGSSRPLLRATPRWLTHTTVVSSSAYVLASTSGQY